MMQTLDTSTNGLWCHIYAQ